MANSYATSSIVAKESLILLENQLGFSKGVNRAQQSEFISNKNRGYAPGETINIKKPPRFQYRAGRIASPQGTVIPTVPLTLSQGGVDIYMTSAQRTVSIDNETMQETLKSAMSTVANQVDLVGLELAHQTAFNYVGTPGTLPTTQAAALALINDAGARLNEMAAPMEKPLWKRRSFAINPAMNSSLVQGLAGLFNSQEKLADQYEDGIVVPSLGFTFRQDQNVATHVNGSQPAGPTANAVNGAGQTGSAVTVNSAAITGTITKGSVITFAGVSSVNPQNRLSTGQPARFVVTADVAASATSIPISPAIVTSGNLQNVTNSPANNASLTVLGVASGAYNTNIAYDKDAYTLATVPLYGPSKEMGVGAMSATETYKEISLRVTEYFDGANDVFNMRFDVYFGWAATYPELAVKAVA